MRYLTWKRARVFATLKLGFQPDAKAIALAALVVQSGDARFRRLGRKLNYQLTFERYSLDRIVY